MIYGQKSLDSANHTHHVHQLWVDWLQVNMRGEGVQQSTDANLYNIKTLQGNYLKGLCQQESKIFRSSAS